MGPTGILLTGGKSSRMGMDKGLCEVGGKPLHSYALALLERFCDEILISANSTGYDGLGYPVIRDLVVDAGPLGGIYSCLLKSNNTLNFVISCDMPLIPAELAEHMLEKCHGLQAVIPVFKGYKEPLCACYSTDAAGHFQQCLQTGVYKMQQAVDGLRTLYLPIDSRLPFYHDELFANANDMRELERIGKLIQRNAIK